MADQKKTYTDIPGTFVFTADHSRKGYHLNMFMMSLSKAENRESFKKDESSYLDGFEITPAQKKAVLDRDWNGMLSLGGNVYYTLKLAACDEMPFEANYAHMAGMPRDEFRKMMLSGGRRPEGNLYLSEKDTGKE